MAEEKYLADTIKGFFVLIVSEIIAFLLGLLSKKPVDKVSMCTGTAESRGLINGDDADPLVSKVGEDCHEHKLMKGKDDNDGEAASTTCNDTVSRFTLALSLSEIIEELRSMAKIACPIMMTGFLLYSRSAISMLFLGRQGKVELAGGSLAIGFINITANSIIKGLTMGMDPICCQAFGAKRWSLLSQTFAKTLSLLLLVSIPVSLAWLNMTPILHWLGQEPEVTRIAQVYILFSIPELFAQATLNPLRTFLRTQGLTSPLTIAASCAAILHLPINYFLATYLRLGVKGIALATGLNSINMILGLVFYIFFSEKALKPWEGATVITAFHGWKPLLSLALPSCISVCLEWWWYEIMLFLCGLLSNPQTTVATMGILIQTTGFLYVFPFALSAALTTRVGHSLGAGQASATQCTAIVGFWIALTFGVFAFLFLLSVRSVWAKMFTNEIEIINMVKTVLPILGLCEIGNWPQTAACGILSGTARPYVGARINLCAFYLIGLPVAIFATFVCRFGLVGLWSGMLAAQVSCVCMMVYALIQTDWGHQTKRAEDLAKVEGDQQKNVENDDEETGLLNSDL